MYCMHRYDVCIRDFLMIYVPNVNYVASQWYDLYLEPFVLH